MVFEADLLPDEIDPIVLGLNWNSIITKNLNDSD